MQRYRYVRSPGHPLGSHLMPEHRIVLFDAIGYGPHRCHWCEGPVNWRSGRSGINAKPGTLLVDHLDDDGRNNDRANLVPACQPCNLARSARHIRAGEPFVVDGRGKRVRAVSRTCEECSTAFLLRTTDADRPGKGRFCSRSCARRSSALQRWSA